MAKCIMTLTAQADGLMYSVLTRMPTCARCQWVSVTVIFSNANRLKLDSY